MTEIKCIIGSKPTVPGDDSGIVVKVDGKGIAATQGIAFRYVSRWSDTQTWGGFPPGEGDAVQIPKGMHLLVDIPATPVLSFVNVGGSLIFDSSADRTFDAGYVIAKDGYIEVGTEDAPYLSNLVITMHGDKTSPKLPVFGNKVIAVKDTGRIEMHGQPRDITWTSLPDR